MKRQQSKLPIKLMVGSFASRAKGMEGFQLVQGLIVIIRAITQTTLCISLLDAASGRSSGLHHSSEESKIVTLH